MNQLLADLKAIRDLLAVPERWTQNAYARNAWGSRVEELDDIAVCYCLVGAINKIISNKGQEAGMSNQRWLNIESALLPERTFGETLARLNDDPDCKHADILELIDKAIERQSA